MDTLGQKCPDYQGVQVSLCTLGFGTLTKCMELWIMQEVSTLMGSTVE